MQVIWGLGKSTLVFSGGWLVYFFFDFLINFIVQKRVSDICLLFMCMGNHW